MVKCFAQEHNMLVTAGFEPATFGLRANFFIHCATHAPGGGGGLNHSYMITPLK